MSEAKIVILQPTPHRSFWQKAREGKDDVLLAIVVMTILLLMAAMVLTLYFFSELSIVLTINQVIIVFFGMLAEMVLFIGAVYDAVTLIEQIEERE